MKKWLLMCCVLIVSGCTSKLAYNNIDWLVYWYLDDYIELTDAQETVFDKNLKRWINWHKSEELGRYIDQLETLKADVQQDNLTSSTINSHLERATSHWDRARHELAPELARMATQLSEKQVVRLFAALESDNEEEQEVVDNNREKTEKERIEERRESFEEDMEERLGDLTDAQEMIIAQYAPLFLSTHPMWLEYRRNIQQKARELFVRRQYEEDFTQQLINLMINLDDYRSEDYKVAREKNRVLYTQMASEIASTLTPKQKRKLVDQLQDMIDDLKDLQD